MIMLNVKDVEGYRIVYDIEGNVLHSALISNGLSCRGVISRGQFVRVKCEEPPLSNNIVCKKCSEIWLVKCVTCRKKICVMGQTHCKQCKSIYKKCEKCPNLANRTKSFCNSCYKTYVCDRGILTVVESK